MNNLQRHSTPNMNTYFITGCSTGLGKALVAHLLPQGKKVIATVRQSGTLAKLMAQYPDQLLEVVMDLTQTTSIHVGVDKAIGWAGRVDVVVNNAGYGLVGGLEGMTMDQIRHQFEVNFFGAVEITKLFIPHFRANGGGRFLHVSSVAGINASAGGSVYSASKFALEGLSEGLAREGANLNIYSTLIEPGPFRTDWAGRSLVYAKPTPEYGEPLEAFKRYLEGANGNQKGSPEKAAAAMQLVAETDNPPLRILLGAAAYRVAARKLEAWQSEIEQWRSIGEPTDFED